MYNAQCEWLISDESLVSKTHPLPHCHTRIRQSPDETLINFLIIRWNYGLVVHQSAVELLRSVVLLPLGEVIKTKRQIYFSAAENKVFLSPSGSNCIHHWVCGHWCNVGWLGCQIVSYYHASFVYQSPQHLISSSMSGKSLLRCHIIENCSFIETLFLLFVSVSTVTDTLNQGWQLARLKYILTRLAL